MPNTEHFPASEAKALLEAPIRAMGVAKVARCAGLNRNTVGWWLAGKADLALENRLRLAEVCGYAVGVSVVRVDPERS